MTGRLSTPLAAGISAANAKVSGLIGAKAKMRELKIVWQRLVTSDGATCDPCGVTFEALQRAVAKLGDVLAPLDLAPQLEMVEISQADFKTDPSSSNRIWLGGKPLEEWLGGRAGSSRCCSVCGESECRTLEVDGAVFESVPENLIIKAALLAAAQVIGSTGARSTGEKDLCSCAPACCVDVSGG